MNSATLSNIYLSKIRKYITDLKQYEIYSNEIDETLSKIDLLKPDDNQQFVDVIVLGNFNSGKTSFLNAIIATKIENYETPLLPSCESENTYYITAIENSKDDMFSIECNENGESKYTNRYNNIKELAEHLSELDKKSNSYLYELMKNELNEEDTGNENQVPEIFIKISVPNFFNNIRLIDTPGLTSKTIKERFCKMFLNKSLFPIFIFLRSLVQENIIEKTTFSVLLWLKEVFKYGIFVLCLSKKDQLIEKLEGTKYLSIKNKTLKRSILIEKGLNAEKYLESLNNFFNNIQNEPESFYLSKIFILNSRSIFDEDKDSIIEMKNVITFLEFLPQTRGEQIKLINLKFSISTLIGQLNNKISQNKFFSDKELNSIKSIFDNDLKNHFSESINEWLGSIEKYDDFKIKYHLTLKEIHKKFIKIDRVIFANKMYLKRSTYIRNQFDELKTEFELLITNSVQELINDLFENFANRLPSDIKDKLLLDIEYKGLSSPNEISLKYLRNYFNLGMSAVTAVLGLLFRKHNSSIPLLSIIFGTFFLFLDSDNIGFWKRLNCWESVIILIHKSIISNAEEIFRNIIDQYEEITEEFINKISNEKEIITEIKNLHLLSANFQFDDEEKKSFEVLMKEAHDNIINEDDETTALVQFIGIN